MRRLLLLVWLPVLFPPAADAQGPAFSGTYVALRCDGRAQDGPWPVSGAHRGRGRAVGAPRARIRVQPGPAVHGQRAWSQRRRRAAPRHARSRRLLRRSRDPAFDGTRCGPSERLRQPGGWNGHPPDPRPPAVGRPADSGVRTLPLRQAVAGRPRRSRLRPPPHPPPVCSPASPSASSSIPFAAAARLSANGKRVETLFATQIRRCTTSGPRARSAGYHEDLQRTFTGLPLRSGRFAKTYRFHETAAEHRRGVDAAQTGHLAIRVTESGMRVRYSEESTYREKGYRQRCRIGPITYRLGS